MAASVAPIRNNDHGDASLPAEIQLRAGQWVRSLGRWFKRTVVLHIEGTAAIVAAHTGFSDKILKRRLSLVEPTPLRWAIEAATPLINAGTAPGGDILASSFEASTPRAYAVLPLVVGGRLIALAYVDSDAEPLPLDTVAKLLQFCSDILIGRTPQEAPEREQPRASAQDDSPRHQIDARRVFERFEQALNASPYATSAIESDPRLGFPADSPIPAEEDEPFDGEDVWLATTQPISLLGRLRATRRSSTEIWSQPQKLVVAQPLTDPARTPVPQPIAPIEDSETVQYSNPAQDKESVLDSKIDQDSETTQDSETDQDTSESGAIQPFEAVGQDFSPLSGVEVEPSGEVEKETPSAPQMGPGTEVESHFEAPPADEVHNQIEAAIRPAPCTSFEPPVDREEASTAGPSVSAQHRLVDEHIEPGNEGYGVETTNVEIVPSISESGDSRSAEIMGTLGSDVGHNSLPLPERLNTPTFAYPSHHAQAEAEATDAAFGEVSEIIGRPSSSKEQSKTAAQRDLQVDQATCSTAVEALSRDLKTSHSEPAQCTRETSYGGSATPPLQASTQRATTTPLRPPADAPGSPATLLHADAQRRDRPREVERPAPKRQVVPSSQTRQPDAARGDRITFDDSSLAKVTPATATDAARARKSERRICRLDEHRAAPTNLVASREAPSRATPARYPKAVSSLAFALGTLMVISFVQAVAPPQRSNHRFKAVSIAKNATLHTIATQLEQQGLVRTAIGFNVLARLTGSARHLKAGRYSLPTHAWAWQVLRELRRGQVRNRTFTVPEGLRIEEIAQVIETAGIATSEEFITAARQPALLERYGIKGQSAEGFLFPETYSVAEGVSPVDIVEIMIEQFYREMQQLSAAAGIEGDRLYEAVTLASIVQREAARKDEMPRIAGVFYNRLNNGMRLESCATVQHVLGHTKERLSLQDVRTPSPYNTYLNAGLPPGPIASPGLNAISASLSPEEHDYLFFFARRDGDRTHIFTRTYAEHKRAQRVFR